MTAIEAWLFDKNDINTQTVVLLSEYAYSDPGLHSRLAKKGQLVAIRPDERYELHTKDLRLLVEVLVVEYTSDTPAVRAVFERLSLRLDVWQI